MSDTSANIPSFSRSDIQLLVSGYSRGGLHLWGQVGLFTQVLGLGPMNDKSTAVVAWELSELMGHVVCVVDPCSAAPWYLRIVLTPDFIFLGLHWAGSNSPVSLGDYYHSLVDAIRHRPLAMGAMACQQLDFDQEWLDLLRALDGHLGGKAGHLPPSMPTIFAAVPTMLANVTIVAAAAPTFAPPAST